MMEAKACSKHILRFLMNWISATSSTQHPGSAKFLLNDVNLSMRISLKHPIFALVGKQTVLEIP